MAENILKKIVELKKKKIDKLKKELNHSDILESIKKNKKYIDFKSKILDNIKKNKISLIAEIKKASPSAGAIIENYDPVEIANTYKLKNATCLSVLTEEDFFYGNLIHISKIKEKVSLPILCKDFFVDKFQVSLAKSYGADAILIILSAISDQVADQIYNEALKLEMSVIVEVHTKEEARRALKYENSMIGINNRNLKTLKTNLNTTYDIYSELVSHPGPFISESGIKNKDEIIEITNNTEIKSFLIGESLLKNLEKNDIFSIF